MPTYEYICTKCDHQFEKFQPMAEAPLTMCPKEDCGRKRWGKGKVKRLISAGAGLIFKGTGFYITDYRSDTYRAEAKKEAGGSGGDKKGETKPEAKSSASPARSETKGSPPKSNGS